MDIDRMIEAGIAEIKQNVRTFCENRNLDSLTPELAEEMTQGLKQAVSSAGVAMFREFLSAYEVYAPRIEVDGELYRLKFASEKRYMTYFGDMALERNIFQNKDDSKTYIPLDAAWGMEGEFMTPEVKEAVAFSSGLVTPEETAALLKKCAMFHPHPTAMKHGNRELGAFIEAHRDVLDERIRSQERLPEETKVPAVSMDGTNVLLREKGAKQGRPAQRPRGGKPNGQTTAYKNAMVASLSCYGAVPEGKKTPQRLSSRYVSRMPEDRAPTFKRRLEAELDALEAHCAADIVKLLLLDGARNLWNYVDNQKRYDDYEKLIDYWHAVEHLSQAAEALFGKGSEQAKAWYEKYSALLLESDLGAQSVLRSMDYYETKRTLSKSRQQELQTQRTFFSRNKHRMTYAHFRRQGWPIGSGPVEAACKTLVKARLCRSGMRWSREGGQVILDFRTYIKSNRWDAAWKHIKRLQRAA